MFLRLASNIPDCLEFKEGHLPIRYLGLPLISGKLSAHECKPLIEKISARIQSWGSKHLSFAGRIQLISAVLFSIQAYWTNVFILPKKVIKQIESLFNAYLWNASDDKATGAKVSWNVVCTPKK